ncbi:MAG: sigma-70 family RNA polymerase sigma factor [Ilumatobacter sp.]|uniref:RNA polymerase sigma factor n=1 Tax=Ilumatobacter sp. TaxID=1967498 RepID=UPI002624191F|nr:sigma-70 family RNA polymerase sigma factor [Ilumatobacter sp.]MDJ0770733.1 sigma-70 family RNA polymerase sigma factor [Ilumatobacter sp.]
MVPGKDDQRRRAYEDLFRANYRAVQGFVQAQYPNVDTAQVMSNTFEIALRRFEDIPQDAERGWLIGVARNCCRNELRAERRRRRRLAEVASLQRIDGPSTSPISGLDLDAVLTAFRQLRPSDQEVMLLAEWHGLLGRDLAAALGVSPSAAAVRLHRARQRLRSLLDEDGGER